VRQLTRPGRRLYLLMLRNNELHQPHANAVREVRLCTETGVRKTGNETGVRKTGNETGVRKTGNETGVRKTLKALV